MTDVLYESDNTEGNNVIYNTKMALNTEIASPVFITTTSTTVTELPAPLSIKGDANCDGLIDMSDAVLIMQALANPNKYGVDGTAEHHLTSIGKENGDMDGDGLTVGDAQAIQEKLLGLSDDENKQLNQNGTTDSNDL